MAGRITGFFREYKVGFSIILSIVGLTVLLIGATGIWAQDIFNSAFSFLKDYSEWSPYFLVLGFIVFGFGIWYLYSYYRDRKFILDEIVINKRSEFIKMHNELRIAVKHMPSKYKKMLKEKEDEFKVK